MLVSFDPEAGPAAANDEFTDEGDIQQPPRVRVDDDGWTELLLKKETKTGKVEVIPNVSNVITYLRYHPKWRGVLAWDAFGEHIITRSPPPWHTAVAPSEAEKGVFRETDIIRVVDWLARNEDLAVGAKLVEQALPVVAEANSFHPVREYLHSLIWDGVERLPTWLSVYCGAKQSEYSCAVGIRWPISAVARVFEPGCQVDCTLVFEGSQGVGKSTACRELMPDKSFYSETGITIGDKDSYQCLHGVWLYVLDELDSLKRSEITKTKNFLTSEKDHYRPSYGRVARDFYRQNIFAGTTNERQYLADRSGNRRFWPVSVGKIDVPAIVRDRDQLWAEAFERYARGERWHVDTPALRRLCEAEQADRVQGDPWENIVAAWLESDAARRFNQDGYLTSDVLSFAIEKRAADTARADEMRIAEVLRTLGYERGAMRREAGTRTRRYSKVVTGGDAGGDTLTIENQRAKASLSLPSLPKSICAQGDEDGPLHLHAEVQNADPGGDGGDTRERTFADDMLELGIGPVPE